MIDVFTISNLCARMREGFLHLFEPHTNLRQSIKSNLEGGSCKQIGYTIFRENYYTFAPTSIFTVEREKISFIRVNELMY